MSLPWAEFLSYWGNWCLAAALIVGVLVTFAVVVSGNVKEAALKLTLPSHPNLRQVVVAKSLATAAL